MPIGDDLRQAMADELRQAMLDGTLDPAQVVTVMHPSDFNQLRRGLSDFGGTAAHPTLLGVEVITTSHQERGTVRVFPRSAFTPPRMIVHPSNLDLESLREEVDRELYEPSFIVPYGTFQTPIFIPAIELDDPLDEPSPPPKSLWELLDENDD